MWNPFRRRPSSPPQLFFKTDMHCHIVPGVDDGSKDVETSLSLLESMRSWGLERVIASPHITGDVFPNDPDILDEALGRLNAALEERGDSFRVERSAEHRLDELFLEQLEKGIVSKLPNNYLLIENSFVQEAWDIDRLIFDLKVKGFNPILAHPERYRFYHNHRNRYDELHSRGTLFQVNLLSFAGFYGKAEQQAANLLLEKGYIDFIGTDLHNHRHAEAIAHFMTTSAYRKLADKLRGKVGNDTAFV